MNFIGKKMSERSYREHPALSRSSLWNLHETPEIFKWRELNPEEPSEALIFGQCFHKLALEPDDFDSEFVVEPNIDKRTKDGKEQYQMFLSSVGERTVIPFKTYEKSCEMVEALNNNKLARALLQGEHECAYFWTDEMTQVQCKCRLDCLRELNGKLVIVDLKTTTSSNTEKWIRDSLRYGYHMQAAMYSESLIANYGVKPDFVFITIQKDEPYAINIFKVTDEYYNYGVDEFRSLIGLYQHCMETGVWYGYLGENDQINDLTLPGWIGGGDD